MIFTEENLRLFRGWFDEREAKSLSQFPSIVGVSTESGELNRVWRVETSEPINFATQLFKKYQTADNIPASFDPAELPTDEWTVDDPMMDGEQYEGKYRHTQLRIYRQKEDGKEYFFFIQTLAAGFVEDVTRTYVYQISTTDGDPDLNDLRFYDTGADYNGENIYYCENDEYAYWNNGTGWIISAVADVGGSPTDYFRIIPDTITVSGATLVPSVNGIYNYWSLGDVGDNGSWKSLSGHYIFQLGLSWLINETEGGIPDYSVLSENDIPPTSAVWNNPTQGDDDLTLTYTFPVNQYIGRGSWTGMVTISSISAIAADFSEFRIMQGEYLHASHEMPVLRIRNVSPFMVHDVCEYLNETVFADDSYSDIKCFNDTLYGTWYRIRVRPEVQEDGSYNILVFLTNKLNETLYYTFMQSASVRRGFLYRREANQASMDEVTDATWFDSAGVKYTEAGTGRYTIGDGGSFPAGWQVLNRSTRRDDSDRLWDIDIEIAWTQDTQFSGLTSITIDNGRITSTTEQGWRATEAQLESRRVAYATLATGQTGKLDFRENGDGLYDYTGVIITTIGVSRFVALATQTLFVGHHIDPNSGTPCATAYPDTITASGCDLSYFNGEFSFSAEKNGWWDGGSWAYRYSSDLNAWELSFVSPESPIEDPYTYRRYSENTTAPDKTGWEAVSTGGSIPDPEFPPTLAYTITTPATAATNLSWADFKAYIATFTGSFSVEENDDGTISYRGTLTSTEDASLYVRTIRGDGSILGSYFVSGSKADCEAVFTTTLFNDSTGIIGTGSTLQQTVQGRTVGQPSIGFDKNDGVYRFTVEMVWTFEDSTKDAATAVSTIGATVPRSGIEHSKRWSEFGVGLSLPTVTLGEYDEDDGLWREITELTAKDGGLLNKNEQGFYEWRLNYDYFSVPSTDWFVTNIAREWVKKEIPLTGSWQQIRRRVGGELEFNRSNIIDPITGQILSSTELSGIEWNLDFEWRDDTQYSSGHCIYHDGVLYTSNTTTTAGAAPDGAGSAEWDATGSAPTAWYTYGYYARYGEWKGYWRKGFSSGRGAIRAGYDDAITCLGKHSTLTYYNPVSKEYSGFATANPDWGNPDGWPVVYNPTDEKFYRLILNPLAPLYTSTTYPPGTIFIGPARDTGVDGAGTPTVAGLCAYTVITGFTGGLFNYFFKNGSDSYCSAGVGGETPGASDWWVEYDDDYVVSKISRDGVGEAPFFSPDIYVPIVAELSVELEWDLTWDAEGPWPSSTAPTNWASEYAIRYGEWFSGWLKGFKTGTDSIRDGYDDASECKGYYGATTYYNPDSADYTGLTTVNPDWGNPDGWPVVYNPTDEKFYRLILNPLAPLYTSTTYPPGTIFIGPARDTGVDGSGTPTVAGLCAYTVITGFTGGLFHYFFEDGSDSYCSVGVGGETPGASDWWVEYDDDYIVSVVSLAGSGVEPFNDAAQVGVINEEGEYAISANTRVSFYTNPHENPEYFVAGQRLRRYEDSIVLRTYFTVEPWRVTNQRIPQTIDALGSSLYHRNDPNIRVAYQEIELKRDQLWCVEMTLVRVGEWEADRQVNSSSDLDGATTDVSGDAQMDGDLRNFPYTDRNGYWSLYHRIPSVGTYTGDSGVTGKPESTFKDVN